MIEFAGEEHEGDSSSVLLNGQVAEASLDFSTGREASGREGREDKARAAATR